MPCEEVSFQFIDCRKQIKNSAWEATLFEVALRDSWLFTTEFKHVSIENADGSVLFILVLSAFLCDLCVN